MRIARHLVIAVLLTSLSSSMGHAQTVASLANLPAANSSAGTDAQSASHSASYSSSISSEPAAVPSEPGGAGSMSISKAAAARNARDVSAYQSLGVSFGQTVGNLHIYSYASDRSAQVPTILYLHPSGHFLWLRFDYMIQEIPVYVLHQPKYYDYDSNPLTTQRRVVLGTGILPVGERMILNPHSKLQISFYSNGGFTYFTRRILSEGATRFNIALQFGNSYQYALTKNSSIIVGYAENHLSNSNIHYKNPGLDMNLFYAQYIVRWHSKR